MAATLTPYLVVRDAARALTFYAEAFPAAETLRLTEPDTGRIGHAEMTIEGATLMLADEFPEHGITGPATLGGSGVTLALVVADVDAVTTRAEAAGATVLQAPKDEFYGERAARLHDPFGHVWHMASRIEEVTQEEMQRRRDAQADGSG